MVPELARAVFCKLPACITVGSKVLDTAVQEQAYSKTCCGEAVESITMDILVQKAADTETEGEFSAAASKPNLPTARRAQAAESQSVHPIKLLNPAADCSNSTNRQETFLTLCGSAYTSNIATAWRLMSHIASHVRLH